jgi:hypothetical protein
LGSKPLPSQSFNGTLNVTLTATGGAPIYYTLDGSTPDSTKTLYTGAIAITSGLQRKMV